MSTLSQNSLNQQIIFEFLNGKSISTLSEETNLDTTYITLVLYQEGIHYTYKEALEELSRNNESRTSHS